MQDGKRLAQTPVKETVTGWESARARKIALAAQETPLLGGMRVLPALTPGRAFLWGSVLAMWGTAAAVAAGARRIGIHSAEDAPGVLRALLAPLVEGMAARAEALKPALSFSSMATESDFTQSLMVRRLKAKLSGVASGV